MGEVNSPLGSVQFQSTEGRRFVVSDETEGAAQRLQEERLQESGPGQKMSLDEALEMRSRRLAEVERADSSGGMDPMAKKRLEILMGVGRATKDITIGEGKFATTFTLRTLKSREQRHVVAASQAIKNPTLADNYDIRDLTLVYAICAIDGIDIDTFLVCPSDASLEKRMALRQAYIGEMDDAVAMKLYAEHTELTDEHLGKFKTPKMRKEVAEQIKKSS